MSTDPAHSLADVFGLPAAVIGRELGRAWRVEIGEPLETPAGKGPLAWAELADAARDSGRRVVLLEHLSASEDHPEVLGPALAGQGRFVDSVEAHAKAMHAEPDAISHRQELGFALLKMGRFDRAAEAYVVRRGDTLWRIAHGLGTTVKALAAANGIAGNRLAIGQRLTIPREL